MKNISKKIIYGLVLAAVVYLALAIWGSASGLFGAFSHFSWVFLPLLLLIVFLNYLIRFIKWQYYLKLLKIKIPPVDSFIIFISGLSLTITPGKLGEVVKSYFLKKGFGTPVSRTAPIVFADRLSDLIAFLILAGVGSWGFSYGGKVIWAVFLLILIIIAAILIRPIGLKFFNLLCRIKFLAPHAERIIEVYETSYELLQPKRLIFPTLVALIAWSFEAVDFYFILVILKLKVSVFAAFFVYCFSTILGAVAMLPGGLGVTDGTIAGLLKLLSIESGTAAFATILIRVVTLWFAVIIGLIFLLLAEKRYDRKTETDTQKVPKGKIKFLFHLHTKASNDGWLDYQTIIDFCRQQKIKQLAVTDHNEIYGALEIKKLANGNPNVIIGEEIKTLEGEIIGLFLNRKIERGQMIGETIRQIREQGGIVCLPHPGDKIRRSAVSCETAEKIIHNIDIVEVFNGRNLFSSTDKFARGLAEKNNKAMIAGADAHLSTELGRVINIIGDFQSKSELVKSLKLTEYVGKKTNIFIQVWCLILKKLK